MQERAISAPPHPAVDAAFPLAKAAAGLLPRLAQLLLGGGGGDAVGSSLQAQQAVVQAAVWHAALWRAWHGSLGADGTVPASELDAELVSFCWIKLRKRLVAALQAMPEAQGLPQSGALEAAAACLDEALGIGGGPPDKPLLWRLGGRPSAPTSGAEWEGLQQLQQLGTLAWWVSTFSQARHSRLSMCAGPLLPCLSSLRWWMHFPQHTHTHNHHHFTVLIPTLCPSSRAGWTRRQSRREPSSKHACCSATACWGRTRTVHVPWRRWPPCAQRWAATPACAACCFRAWRSSKRRCRRQVRGCCCSAAPCNVHLALPPSQQMSTPDP